METNKNKRVKEKKSEPQSRMLMIDILNLTVNDMELWDAAN